MSPRPRKRDRHLPPRVYFRHGAYWYVERGKWRRIGSTLRAALERYAKLRTASLECADGMPKFIDEILPHLTRGKAATTARSYEGAARVLKRALREFTPEQVQPKHVSQIRLGLAKTPALANRCLTVLRLVFAFAVDNHLLETNPVIGTKRYREPPRKRLLTPREYAAIYQKATPRLQVIMDLAIRTGQRIGDVLAIRRADIDDEGIHFAQKKTGARVVVGWTPELRAVVDRAKRMHGNLRALTLLHNVRGQPLRYSLAAKHWNRARIRAGVLDARLHDLRAFAATHARKQGLDATALLAHASAQQTKRYLRDRDEPVVDAPSFGHLADLLDSARGKS